MGMTIDSLKSINGFDKYESYIKNFILSCEPLWHLIYYSYSDPFNDIRAVSPEDPYTIFSRETDNDGKIIDSHGVVLFQDKDDSIQNTSNITILISYESTRLGNDYFFDNHYIIFQIIGKGSSIRKLANGKDRIEAIEEEIDNNFNLARINNIGEVHKVSSKKLNNINEENIGRVLIYSCKGLGTKLSSNVNYNRRKYGVDRLP